MIYQQGTSDIGTLLRLLKEEQAASPAILKPQAEPNSLIRQTVQEPLKSPESPDSQRVVSIRPEGAIQQGQEAGQTITPAMTMDRHTQIIQPIMAKPPAIGTSIAPSNNVSKPPDNVNSRVQNEKPVQQTNSLATKITASPVNKQYGFRKAINVLDYNKKYFVPQRSKIGGQIVKGNTNFKGFTA